MVTSVLVDSKIKVGEKLVRELDRADFPINAELRLYLSEPEVSRLVLASTLVDSHGPKAAYARIDDIIGESMGNKDIPLTWC
jgi:hypothetical protein